MATQELTRQKSLSNVLNDMLTNEATSKMIREALGSEEGKGRFITNIIELTNTDTALAKCQPKDIMMEAFKAVALGIPLSKSLGLGYVICYAGQPQFQLGYRGLYQIARRSGAITKINVRTVWKGEEVNEHPITGDISVTGKPDIKTKEPIGYIAYFMEEHVVKGEKVKFEKAIYWSIDRVAAHAIAYSKTTKGTAEELKAKALAQAKSGKVGGAVGWYGNFEAMAHKTVLKSLLSHWATIDPFSTLGNALDADTLPDRDSQVAANAAQTSVTEDVPYEEVNTATGEVKTEQPKNPQAECDF